jgi:hypothetical protein
MVLSVLLRAESKGYVLWLDGTLQQSSAAYKFSFDTSTGYPPVLEGPKTDVPYHYHLKLISILAKSAVGTSGIYINEAK